LLSDGSISYGFSKGIYKFYPKQLIEGERPLKVHITSFNVNGKSALMSNYIDAIDTVSLKYYENNLTIGFAAVNFTNPLSTMYSYFLEGADEAWSAPSNIGVVNFSRLSPGDYKLRIRAGLSGFSSNAPEKALVIRIIPAWWQTTWFRWLVIISVITFMYFTLRFFLSLKYRQKIAKLEQQRAIENIRVGISRDIHDEIGSGLTKIKLMSRNLINARELNEDLLQTSMKISSESDELIQNLGEIVWTVNPSNDSLENIFAYLRNYLSKSFEDNPGITLNLDFTEPDSIPKDVLINPDIKRNLLLIVKESITNIFKHSGATEVSVLLHADESGNIPGLKLNITDNGIGINGVKRNSTGNGINNIQKRAEAMNASVEVTTSSPGGTHIQIYIPFKDIKIVK
jgi:signal transduction histidine kinase